MRWHAVDLKAKNKRELMRVIDLTMPIADHFRWKVERRLVMDQDAGDHFHASWIGMPVHAVTHIDSRRHMLPEGPTLDDTPMSHLVGTWHIIDISDIGENQPVERKRLESAAEHLPERASVLMKSCWGTRQSFEDKEFWTRAPYMTREACEFLLEREIRAIAFDFPQDYSIRYSITGGTCEFDEHVTHDTLLRHGVTLIEYLTNTESLSGDKVFLCALPIKIAGTDGAPARVIAMEDMDRPGIF